METTKTEGSKLKLTISYLILIIFIGVFSTFILATSFANLGPIINYAILIVMFLFFGLLYKWLQDGFNSSFEFEMKSSVITSTILLSVFTSIIGIFKNIIESTQEVYKTAGLIGEININIFVFPFIFLIFFNSNYLLLIYREKEYFKYILYLFPLFFSWLILYAIEFIVASLIL